MSAELKKQLAKYGRNLTVGVVPLLRLSWAAVITPTKKVEVIFHPPWFVDVAVSRISQK